MTTLLNSRLLRPLFGAVLLATPLAMLPAATFSQEQTGIASLATAEDPPLFDSAAAAIDAFKAVLKADDFDGFAKLLGLDAAKLKASDGVTDTYDQIREGAAKQVVATDLADRTTLAIGERLWPLPFPIVKGDDGKWAFDTYDGLQEIINRRVGENEIEAIATARAYVDAQRDYATADHDEDGVLEYAQKLISTEGTTDGLYWHADEANGVSPAGDFADAAAMDKAQQTGGYFGYHFRILTGQGDNIAGGAYDYVINGNMIAGFALIAWPVTYAETGVKTFVVGNQGIVYEADLGPDTEALVAKITTFNPDSSWELSEDD